MFMVTWWVGGSVATQYRAVKTEWAQATLVAEALPCPEFLEYLQVLEWDGESRYTTSLVVRPIGGRFQVEGRKVGPPARPSDWQVDVLQSRDIRDVLESCVRLDAD